MQSADRSNLIILTPADDTTGAVLRPLCRVMLPYAMLNCFSPAYVHVLYFFIFFYNSEAQCCRAMAVYFGVICSIMLRHGSGLRRIIFVAVLGFATLQCYMPTRPLMFVAVFQCVVRCCWAAGTDLSEEWVNNCWWGWQNRTDLGKCSVFFSFPSSRTP